MARKRNLQNNGLDQQSQNHKKGVSDPGSAPSTTVDRGDVNEEKVSLGEELNSCSYSVPSIKSIDDIGHAQDGKKRKTKSRKS